jgi:large subunit ribosomal protein L3
MSIGLFGKKLVMTQIFNEFGIIFPVTLVQIKKCQINQIKTLETDGYNSIQVRWWKENTNNFKDLVSRGEFRVNDTKTFELGENLTLTSFHVGQKVQITGKSSGKGFAGTQKRHRFKRGLMTHGSKNHRLPGSIGAGSTPGRVLPGKRMAGQLGDKVVTVKNSEIMFINTVDNILVLKGSLPGKQNSIVKIHPQITQ